MNISTNILPKKTRVVILDLDGTLYAKTGIVWRMMLALPRDWKKMLAERKTRKLMRGQWAGDLFNKAYFETLAQLSGLSPATAKNWYEEVYMPQMLEVIRQHYPLAAWVLPFVEECKQEGLQLVVLSDYGHTHEKLAALGVSTELFDWVVSAPELGGLKPAKELLLTVATKMGVLPEECFVIGDREDTDGEMARTAGANFYFIQQ